MIKYSLRKDTVYDEDGQPFLVYGINAVNRFGKKIKIIPDIFFDESKAKRFVARCNSEKVNLTQLQDMAESQLT